MKNSRTARLKARNEKITARFWELKAEKYKNLPLYAQDAVLEMVADEYHLSARTIENIVFNRVQYKEPTTEN